MSNSQAPNATAQGEMLLAKYLTDSIRSLEQAIRKSAPVGATVGNLPRSLSAPRLDYRSDGRRPATEVLLPRKLPLNHAPAAAAALAATRRDDFGHTLGGQVATTQARLLQPGPGAPLPPRSQGGGLPPQPKPAAASPSSLPPRPAPAVVRTAHAIAAALQQQQYGKSGGGAANRSTSAPRLEDDRVGQGQHQHHNHHHHHHHHHHHSLSQGNLQGQQGSRQVAQSEARIPAVAAAPPLAGLLGAHGGGGGAVDARSAASVRRSAPSDAGTHSSWWRWRPVTDASYPLTAITDRYAQSMTPSEAGRWNDRVARLEAEITQEKERRKQFEQELKKLQVATSATQTPGGMVGGAGHGGARGPSKGGAAPAFR